MAAIFPIKVVRNAGNSVGLSEFNPGDTIPQLHLPPIEDFGGATQLDLLDHVDDTDNPHDIDPAQIGAIPSSEKGQPNGVATLGGDGLVTPAQLPVFGQGFVSANSWQEQGTTGTAWVNKVSIPIPIFAGQTFRVGWQYLWAMNSTTQDFRGRITFDGTTYLEHRQEPKDSSGTGGSAGTDQRQVFSGFDYYTAPVDQSITVNIDFASGSSGIRASIFEARLEAWRVL